jgi:RNA ligase
MKTYHSIPHMIAPGRKKNFLHTELDVIAFDKCDGSNIRAEWSPKRGFYKFGSRKCLIDEKHEQLGKSVGLIQDTCAAELAKVFKDERWEKAICFFEFYGPRSFAGNHHEDDDHQVTLFDVNPHKRGMVSPRDFIKLFGHLEIPEVLYEGLADDKFVDAVHNSTLPGITLEGVVCKAPNPNGKKTSQPIMFKLKTKKWLDMLREFVNYDEALFQRLM